MLPPGLRADYPALPLRAPESGWTVTFTPYAWLISLTGSQTVRGRTVDVDETFFDIVHDTIGKGGQLFAAMAQAEARHGPFSLFGDAGGRKTRRPSLRVASILAIDLFITGPAFAQDLVAVGLLSCETQRVTGMMEVQRQKLSCSYMPAAPGPPSNLLGEIEDLGPPIGVSERTSFVWEVLTVSGITSHGLLPGSYSNAASPNQIESTLLRGGPREETYLRVVSVNGRTEPNFVYQVTALSLRPAE